MISSYLDKDYSVLCSIWERSVAATHHFLSKEDFEFFKQKTPSFFPSVDIYVFEEESVIRGFLGVKDDNIEMLFVDPLYFGQGVGKALLLYAIEKLGMKKVDVNEMNVKAFDFYKLFGFKEIRKNETDGFGKPYPICNLEILN